MRGVLLYSYRPEATIQFLIERFGYSKTGEENQIVRLQSEARIGHIIDVDLAPKEAGTGGYGQFIMSLSARAKKSRRSGRTFLLILILLHLTFLTGLTLLQSISEKAAAFYLKWQPMNRAL